MNDNRNDIDLTPAADAIDPGSAETMLTHVQNTVDRRRRRRNAVAGVAAVGTLAVSGIVVANVAGGGSNDRLISSPVDDSADQSADTVAEAEPAVTTPPTTAIAVLDPTAVGGAPISVNVVAASGQEVIDAESGDVFNGGGRLLAWNGGFLSLSQNYTPQPLPAELSDEIVELFSPEVQELFADGLPPTIGEATERLQEAGLLDEVADVIARNPAASEAIYSQNVAASDSSFSARFSPDGLEWSDVDIEFPDAAIDAWSAVAAGDRLAFIVQPSFGPFDASTGGASEFQVVSTTDLTTWTTQTFAAPERPADLPEYVNYSVYANQLVATEDHWVTSFGVYTDVDVFSLVREVDPELIEGIESLSGGYGSDSDGEGVTFEGYDEDGNETETARFTWDELGVDPSFVNDGADQQTLVASATWDGEPEVSNPTHPSRFESGQLVVVGDLIVSNSWESGVFASTDGTTWTEFGQPDDGFIEGIMPAGDELVVFTSSPGGESEPYQLDLTTGAWTLLDIAGLPEQFSLSNRSSNGVATLFEYDESFGNFGPQPGGTQLSVETDGYLFELTVRFTAESITGSYTLTEMATGEVASTETLELGPSGHGDEDFEFAEEVYDINGTDEGFRVFDPETGEQLVEVPFSDADWQELDADGNVIEDESSDEEIPVATAPEADGEFAESEYVEPRQWVLATDGTNWLVEQITDGGTAEFAPGFGDGVVANGVVLLASHDGMFIRYELG